MERDERKEWEWEEALAAKAIAEAETSRERGREEQVKEIFEDMKDRPLYKVITVTPKKGKPYLRQMREWNYMATRTLVYEIYKRLDALEEAGIPFTRDIFHEEGFGEIEPGLYLEDPWEDAKHTPADVLAILEEQGLSYKVYVQPPAETYDEYALNALRKEVQEFGGVVVPERRYARLKNVQDRLKQLKTELKHAKNKSELSEARLKAQVEESKKEIERLKTPRPRPSYGDTVDSLEEYLKNVKKIRGVY